MKIPNTSPAGFDVCLRQRIRYRISVLGIGTLVVALCGCSPAGDTSSAAARRNATPTESQAGDEAAMDTAALDQLCRQTLQYNLDHRLLSAERNAAWQVLHGLLAYREQLPLEVAGERHLALDYLLKGGELAGWDLYPGTQLSEGRTGVRARVEANGYISQGHVDQWLAILAQLRVPLEQTVVVANKEHTLRDWIEQAQLDVPNNPLDEFSWTVMAALLYRPELNNWKAADGTPVSLSELIEYESRQDIFTSACGGSHRLMCLAMATKHAHAQDLTGDPGYQAAERTLAKSLAAMKNYQNKDGSFSTNYFQRPGTSADLSLMISATGHQLELAAYALPQEDLEKPWMRRAVYRFCKLLEATSDEPLETGGLYHGLNGLRIYYDRCFGTWQPSTPES